MIRESQYGSGCADQRLATPNLPETAPKWTFSICFTGKYSAWPDHSGDWLHSFRGLSGLTGATPWRQNLTVPKIMMTRQNVVYHNAAPQVTRWRLAFCSKPLRGIQRVLIGSALPFFLASCAVEPTRNALELPAVALSVIGNSPVVDERPDFRSVFCEVLRSKESFDPAGGCDDYLWRLPDEKPAAARQLSGYAVDSRLRILIVGGAFGDCYPPASTPFAEDVNRLKSRGVSIEIVSVSGRSTVELNAKTIADRIADEPPDDTHPIILVGYSKGTADILDALTKYPEAAARVSAVVSIAGAVNGSPLSSRYLGLYDRLLANLAFGSCPPGDGGVLGSLSRVTRLSWLADNTIPNHILYYSIGTFTTPSRLARILAYPQRQLSRIDARNDGQLLVQDQLVPGSKLLGYANADHWSVAVRMEDRFPFLAHRTVGKHPFPQQVLLESILLFVQRDLIPPVLQQ